MNHFPSERQKLESKIAFLQQQLDSLDHYLPETYQYLMEQMDSQQVLLKQLEVQEHFEVIDSSAESLSPCDALEST
jgi:hypothetical protein